MKILCIGKALLHALTNEKNGAWLTASLSQPTIMTMDNIVPFHVSSTTNMSHFQDMTHTTSNIVHESPLAINTTASMQRPRESVFLYPFTVEETNPKMIHELMVHRDPSEHFIRESSRWSLDQRIVESLLSASDIFFNMERSFSVMSIQFEFEE